MLELLRESWEGLLSALRPAASGCHLRPRLQALLDTSAVSLLLSSAFEHYDSAMVIGNFDDNYFLVLICTLGWPSLYYTV